jgi:hypothetical protein
MDLQRWIECEVFTKDRFTFPDYTDRYSDNIDYAILNTSVRNVKENSYFNRQNKAKKTVSDAVSIEYRVIVCQYSIYSLQQQD